MRSDRSACSDTGVPLARSRNLKDVDPLARLCRKWQKAARNYFVHSLGALRDAQVMQDCG